MSLKRTNESLPKMPSAKRSRPTAVIVTVEPTPVPSLVEESCISAPSTCSLCDTRTELFRGLALGTIKLSTLPNYILIVRDIFHYASIIDKPLSLCTACAQWRGNLEGIIPCDSSPESHTASSSGVPSETSPPATSIRIPLSGTSVQQNMVASNDITGPNPRTTHNTNPAIAPSSAILTPVADVIYRPLRQFPSQCLTFHVGQVYYMQPYGTSAESVSQCIYLKNTYGNYWMLNSVVGDRYNFVPQSGRHYADNPGGVSNITYTTTHPHFYFELLLVSVR